jgi:CSLREA domain-containing protein
VRNRARAYLRLGAAPVTAFFVAALVLPVALAPLSPVAAATAITVTTTADELSNNGQCSLREAILAAGTNAPVDTCGTGISTAPDTIILPAGVYLLTRADAPPPEEPFPPRDEDAGLTGDLDVRGGLVLRGAGATATIIDGGQLNRVVQVMAGANVTLQDLTIRNGLTHLSENGGGVKNAGTLSVIRSTITGNATFHDLVGSRCCPQIFVPGGGIYNTGTLSVTDSLVSANLAVGQGGGIANDGGTLHVLRTTLSTNSAECFRGGDLANCPGGEGGGIANTGRVDVTQSTVDANSAADAGGGIWNSGVLNITASTVSHNTAAGDASDSSGGGGIFNSPTGALTATNITISSNNSVHNKAGGPAGGVLNLGNLTLVSATISANSADRDGGGLVNTTAFNGPPAQLSLSMTIVAGNQALGVNPDCGGEPVVSSGSNLIGDPTGCTINGVSTGNLLGANPRLGPLANNGGTTSTHALLTGSPALDAVKTGSCPTVDQRGVARRQDGNLDGRAVCDMGAFELAPPPAPTCMLSGAATDAAGRQFIRVTTQDLNSGLKSIQVTLATNATVSTPTFASGTHSPVVVTATKRNQALASQLGLRVTNVAGRSTVCDPVLADLRDGPRQTFSGLQQSESRLSLTNGDPGLRRVDVEVNGHDFRLDHLKDGEERKLDVSSAMRPGNHNTIRIKAHGGHKSSALLLISD